MITSTLRVDTADRQEEYDCTVSDYLMPETDGLEQPRQIRMFDIDLPYMLFTGQGPERIANDAISLAVTDYLTKGGSPERFTRLANRTEGTVHLSSTLVFNADGLM